MWGARGWREACELQREEVTKNLGGCWEPVFRGLRRGGAESLWSGWFDGILRAALHERHSWLWRQSVDYGATLDGVVRK